MKKELTGITSILLTLVLIIAAMTGCSAKTEDAAYYSDDSYTISYEPSYDMAVMESTAESPMMYDSYYYPQPEYNTEEYSAITENGYKSVSLNPLSTFSADVDTASYSNVRRYIDNRELPPADAVRIEELINAGKIIRPAYKSIAPKASYTDLIERITE